MRIDKVFHNPTSGKTNVDYSTRENDGKDNITHRLESSDEPSKLLVRALDNLRPEVERLCNLPLAYLDAVRGITLHRDDDDGDIYTVTYTATAKISESKSPLVLNTPLTVPSDECRTLVDDVLKHARKFLEGKRLQQELPLEGPKSTQSNTTAPAAPAETGTARTWKVLKDVDPNNQEAELDNIGGLPLGTRVLCEETREVLKVAARALPNFVTFKRGPEAGRKGIPAGARLVFYSNEAVTEKPPESTQAVEKPKGKKAKAAAPAPDQAPNVTGSKLANVYRALQGRAEVKRDAATGKWWGRLDGKPYAQGLDDAVACMNAIERSGTGALEWVGEDPTPDAAPKEVPAGSI